MRIAASFFFFVQKYSIWSVSCRNIHIMVYCAKLLVRYLYMLHENEANQWITSRFSKFIIQLCKKKRFHNFYQISQYQPNITISAKYHNTSQISQFWPNFTKSGNYHNFDQISQYQPNFTISAKFHNISQISQFQPNFTISATFHNISQKWQFRPNCY